MVTDLVVSQELVILLVCLEEGDQIGPFFSLLETGEDHLGAGNELFGVLEVLVQVALRPGDTLFLIGLRVLVPGGSAALAAHDPAQIWTHLVLATHIVGVALGALLHEDLLAVLRITCSHPGSLKMRRKAIR